MKTADQKTKGNDAFNLHLSKTNTSSFNRYGLLTQDAPPGRDSSGNH